MSTTSSVVLLPSPSPEVAEPLQPQTAEARWQAADRQDWHLWVLAFLLMFVLGVSLLGFMFPSAFWHGEDFALKAPHRAFLGFCVLLGLALVYMLQRQREVRRLKDELFRALAAAAEAERKAYLLAFSSQPGMNQFQDSLSMDFKRASAAGTKLATTLFDLGSRTPEEMGRIITQLRGMLRRGESLFRLSNTTLGAIFPDMSPADANSFACQAQESLRVSFPSLTINATTTCYPQEVGSYSEMQAALKSRIG